MRKMFLVNRRRGLVSDPKHLEDAASEATTGASVRALRPGMHRKLPLRSLGALRMSQLSDNFLAIINPGEYDCLVVGPGRHCSHVIGCHLTQ